MAVITPSPEFLELQALLAGRYSIQQELGRGGMGVVFLARDVALDRLVAIKLLPGHLARAPDMRERFLREARTAAKLSHPNIVPIYLVEENGGMVFFVMAYVDGESLGQRVRRAGPLVPSEVNRIVREVAWALEHAHGQGVIHRDVKPDNILLERGSGRAMVTDFGIAHLAGADSMTAKGELIGTAHYMSPEQSMGEVVDGRSDLYSLGISAFYALTGKLPFDAPNVPAILTQHVNLPAPRVASQGSTVPARLAEVVDRCLAKGPADRFASGRELAEALAEAGGVRLDITPQVRLLLRYVRGMGVLLGGLTAAFWVTGIYGDELLQAIWQLIRSMNPADLVFGGVMLCVVAVQFPGLLFKAARQVVRDGLTHTDVANALLAEGRAVDEEKQVSGEKPEKRHRRKTWIDRLIKRSWAVAAFGVATSVISFQFGDMIGTFFGGPAILVAALVFWSAGPVVYEESPLRGVGLAERLMAGRFGKLLLRLAGIGVKRADRIAPSAGDRTEIVLASGADELFRNLESTVRKRFAEVPDVISRLEAGAVALRKREHKLGDVLSRVALDAGAGHHHTRTNAAEEMVNARDRVRQRLATAVTALEGIRLDLLRLHAGVGSPDDLTANLERARDISEAVNAELAGREEVDRLLES
jgi:serine/threonine-protein kinase